MGSPYGLVEMRIRAGAETPPAPGESQTHFPVTIYRMIASLENSLSALRRRAGFAAYLKKLQLHLSIALFATGSAALLSRVVFDFTREEALWILAIAAVAPLTAWLDSRRAFLSLTGAAAWLDLRTGGDGAVVTAIESRDPRWQERLDRALASQPALPRVQVERSALRTMPAIAFCLLAFWVEMPQNVLGPAPELFESAKERLEEKLETLEEVVELTEDEQNELEAQLEQVEAESEEGTPESFFEAADSLEEALEEFAQEIAEDAQEMQESLEAVSQADDSEFDAAQETLRETLNQMDDMGLGENLPEDLTEMFPKGLELPEGTEFQEGLQLDPEMLKAMSEELKELLANKLAELAEAGLLKEGKLGKPGEGKLADLSKFKPTKAGQPCDCEECKKAGKQTNKPGCKGESHCHNKPCMDAGHCIGGGT